MRSSGARGSEPGPRGSQARTRGSEAGTRAHLRAVRAAALPERLRASTADNAYTGYVAVIVLILLTSPYYALVTILTRPDVLPLLTDTELGPRIASTTGWLLLAAAVLLGRVRGPGLLPPLLASLIGAGPWRRSTALRRPYLRSTGLVLLGLVAVVIAPVVALGIAGRPPLDLVLVLLATLALGLVATVAWLAGQALPRRWSAALAAVCGVLAPFAPLPALGLGLAAVVGGYAVPFLLDRLTGPGLIEQARRWDSVGVAASTGDLAAAAAHLRPPPSLGARWPAIGAGSALPLVFWRRDLVGSLRDPERFVLGALSLVAAGALGASAGAVPEIVRWMVLAAAVAVAYLAAGVWADGYRHTLEAAGAPTLYGTSTAYLLVLHSLLPLSLVAVLGGGGALLVAATVGASPLAVTVSLLGLALAVAARIHAAGKGPLPLELLTPVPTPMGDLSGLTVAVWQVSSLLVAGVAAALAGHLALGGLPLWLLAYPAVAWWLVGGAVRTP